MNGTLSRWVCSNCSSDSISRDAMAVWHVPTQDWILQVVLDAAYCDGFCKEQVSLTEEVLIKGQWEKKQ